MRSSDCTSALRTALSPAARIADAGANNHEDDLDIISKHLSYRPDDYGDTFTASKVLTANVVGSNPERSTVSVVGVIGRTGDADWFAFESGAGSAAFTIGLVPNARADVDLKVCCYSVCWCGDRCGSCEVEVVVVVLLARLPGHLRTERGIRRPC